MHHYHRIHSHMRGTRTGIRASFPSGTLSPAQILRAYGFTQNQYAGIGKVKIGVGSLGGGVVQQDVLNAVSMWGMAAPHIAVRTVGGASNDPTDQDSNVENMLDLIPTMAFTWWWLTGTPADLTITFGPNASGGMELVTRDLIAAGIEVGSWSWGSAASTWDPKERAALAKAFADAVAKGIIFCAASGDNSADDGTSAPSADYPCSDPNVWAVGGTRLVVNADGTRAREMAWGDGRPGDEGGGGGFDASVPMPTWQQGVVPSKSIGRGVPDTSANADPVSGWQMSANGSWTVVGGTSAASPFTAALIAVAAGVAKSAIAKGASVVYKNPVACNDITTGSDGFAAASGWDPATGMGSPNGSMFIAALVAAMTGTAPPAPVPNPPSPPPPAGVPTLDQAITWASQGIQAGHPLQTRAQAIANATAGLHAGWPK